MQPLQSNIRAIEIAAADASAEARAGRNRVVAEYYQGLSPGVREGLTYTHGSQVYTDKSLPEFFRLINKRSITLPIKFIGGDNNALLAAAANDISNMAYQRSLSVRDTGTHLASIQMFFREVGSQLLATVQGPVNGAQLPDRTVVSIVAMVDYASTLEARGAAGGLLYFAAIKARAKYGSQLSIKYDYVSGKKFGMAGGTFPRIQVAHYGNLRPGLKRPGRSNRRRRGYAQAKGRSS